MRSEARDAQPHATTRTYLSVAAVLTVLTAIEFLVVYVEALRPVLVPILLMLAAAKFALVAMFFMHLKFDSRLFSAFFVAGIGVAALVAVVLRFIIRV